MLNISRKQYNIEGWIDSISEPMNIPTKEDCYYIIEMLETELIDYSCIKLWGEELEKTYETLPEWLSDFLSKKRASEYICALENYILTEPLADFPQDIEKFRIACLFLNYKNYGIAWDWFINDVNRIINRSKNDWIKGLSFYEYKNRKKSIEDHPIFSWYQLAEEKFEPFRLSVQSKREHLISLIHEAFKKARYPGDDDLTRSRYGDEPFLLVQEFTGKTQWQVLDSKFIDLAPDGFASALSFFSDRAFCFYIPAYMIAELNRELGSASVIFHLTHGLDNESKNKPLDDERTWFDCVKERFSHFTKDQVQAIVAFLEFCEPQTYYGFYRESINESLNNYWLNR